MDDAPDLDGAVLAPGCNDPVPWCRGQDGEAEDLVPVPAARVKACTHNQSDSTSGMLAAEKAWTAHVCRRAWPTHANHTQHTLLNTLHTALHIALHAPQRTRAVGQVPQFDVAVSRTREDNRGLQVK